MGSNGDRVLRRRNPGGVVGVHEQPIIAGSGSESVHDPRVVVVVLGGVVSPIDLDAFDAPRCIRPAGRKSYCLNVNVSSIPTLPFRIEAEVWAFGGGVNEISGLGG